MVEKQDFNLTNFKKRFSSAQDPLDIREIYLEAKLADFRLKNQILNDNNLNHMLPDDHIYSSIDKNLRRSKTFKFKGMGLRTVNPRSFENYKYLEWIDLSNNLISEIPEDLPDYLPNLKFLNFGYNRITELNLNTFLNLDQLEKLILTGNPINDVWKEKLRNFVRLTKPKLIIEY